MSDRSWEWIDNPEDLEDLLAELDEGPGIAALDFEGWNIVRLAQICNDEVWAVIDFGRKGHNWFNEVAHWFEDFTWIVFNSGHEKRWFAKYGSFPTCWDAGYLRRAIEGGGHMSLKQLVGWELEIEMDKTEQASDWDVPEELSDSQLNYAADDALLTWQAWQKLWDRADEGQRACFNMLDGMADAVIEMEDHGLLLDTKIHTELAEHWDELKADREAELRKLVTVEEVENLGSGKQLHDFFVPLLPDDIIKSWPKTKKTGILSTANKDLYTMSGVLGENPVGRALILLAERATLSQYISNFGHGLIDRAKRAVDGRIHARYNIAAARTCRFSSSAPNVQQIPRDREFFGQRLSCRRSFIAAPGCKLVSLDYSGIELRVLALLSGDEQLLHDVVFGDVHAAIGEYVLGRPLDKTQVKDKEVRQSMKAVNFGIVYGTTALGLAGRQGWNYSYAEDLIDYWAARYPKAFELRSDTMTDVIANDGYMQAIDGGTIFMGKKPSPTRCANYPVQRAALTVMAHAIIEHYDSVCDMRDRGHEVRMAATIHDALIDECVEDAAEETLQLMAEDMKAGYLTAFPGAPTEGLVEGGIGPNWGELEDKPIEGV